jgi:hypothetical protein
MLTNDSELKNSNKILIDDQIKNIFDNSYDKEYIKEFIIIPEKIIVYDNIFTINENDSFVKLLEESGFTNYGNPLRLKYIAHIPYLQKLLIKRINNIIPQYYNDSWIFTSINDCFRCVKCNYGSYLNTHFDSTTIKSINEQSKFTIMIYMSDNNDGSTYFEDYDLNVLPKKGRIIIFDQQLKHSGKINYTLKYLLRSELYYERKEKITNEEDKKAEQIYFEALSINYSNPTKAAYLEDCAFKLSPILEQMVYNF